LGCIAFLNHSQLDVQSVLYGVSRTYAQWIQKVSVFVGFRREREMMG
jgi:hypothetical protein